jgi:hypothetical protein
MSLTNNAPQAAAIVSPEHEEQQRQHVARVEQLVIARQEDMHVAASLQREIDGLIKAIKRDFEEPKRKAKAAHAAVCDQERGHLTPLQDAKSLLARRMGEYVETERRRQEAERREAEEQARREAEEQRLRVAEALERAGEKDLADKAIDEPVIPDPVPAAPEPVRPTVEGQRTVTRWRHTITNAHDAARYIGEQEIGSAGDLAKALDAFVGKLVRASKESTRIPGVTVQPETTVEATGR